MPRRRGPSQMDPPKINFLNGSTWGASLFWYQEIFNRQIFWHSLGVPRPLREPPKWTPQKSFFSVARLRVPVCFDIRRYLTDKYFDIVWGATPLETPPNGPPKNQFFLLLNLGCQCFMILAEIYQADILA